MKFANTPVTMNYHPARQFLVIAAVASFIAAVFMFLSETTDWRFVLVSYLYTFSLWYGNFWFSVYLLNKLPSLEQTRKRLVFNFAFVFIYTLLVVVIVEGVVFRYEEGYRAFVLMYLIGVFVTVLVSAIHGSYTYFLMLLESVKYQEVLKRSHIESELKALTTQVNPHFLFNSLNTLLTIIYENPDLAARFTQKLADVYRYVLQSKNKEVVTLAEELEFAHNYMFLLKIRFGNNFKGNIDIPEEYHHKTLPVLALQILIENATKHNTVSDHFPLFLEIETVSDKLVVTNNINLKNSPADTHGTGLENIQNRYRLLGYNGVEVCRGKDKFSVAIPLIEVEVYAGIGR